MAAQISHPVMRMDAVVRFKQNCIKFATGSQINFSLLPHLTRNLKQTLVCPITDSQ